MKRVLLLLVFSGVVCTALSTLVTYEYCVGGPGRGLPFAVTHPGHGPEALEFVYEGSALEGQVLDLGALGLDLGVWSVLVGLPFAFVRMWRRRYVVRSRKAEDDE